MKTILCFGDSLTWGFNPENFERYPYQLRWTIQLQSMLGEGHRVIEEGFNGRTTVIENPYKAHCSGIAALPMLLESHSPIDLVIIMLGSNDLQLHCAVSAPQAAAGCVTCINKIQMSMAGPKGTAPKTLLMAPPPMKQPAKGMELFFTGAKKESENIAQHYKTVANMMGVDFFDAGAVVSASELDGIHLDEPAQAILAAHLAEKIRPTLSL
jgi:lysophospholipase L1-like esterase